jgi:WD40 repeat protein
VTPVLQEGHSALVKALSFTPDEKVLASASWDWSVRIWEWPTGRLLRTFAGRGKQAESVVFQPHSSLVASADEKGVYVWDPHTGNVTKTLSLENVKEIAFSPGGDAMAIATLQGSYLWRLEGPGDPIQLSNDDARAIAVSPNGRLAASGNANSTVHVFDLETLKIRRTIPADEAWVCQSLFCRTGSGSPPEASMG